MTSKPSAEIREEIDKQVLAVWADCAGIADTLYEDESLAGNAVVISAIHAANKLSKRTEDMKDNLDSYALAIKGEVLDEEYDSLCYRCGQPIFQPKRELEVKNDNE